MPRTIDIKSDKVVDTTIGPDEFGKRTPTAATVDRLNKKRTRRAGKDKIRQEIAQWKLPHYPVRNTSPQAASELR